MEVWVLTSGGQHDGYSVEAVYATKEAGLVDLEKERLYYVKRYTEMHESQVGWDKLHNYDPSPLEEYLEERSEITDDEVCHYIGCDFAALRRYEVKS